jgi:hypothetical protein
MAPVERRGGMGHSHKPGATTKVAQPELPSSAPLTDLVPSRALPLLVLKMEMLNEYSSMIKASKHYSLSPMAVRMDDIRLPRINVLLKFLGIVHWGPQQTMDGRRA